MKFVIITKSSLDYIPPVISVALILRDLNHDVHILTSGASPSVISRLDNRDVSIDIFPYTTASNPIKKMWEYVMFRKAVNKRLSELTFDYIWVEGAITIRSLGTSILKYPYVLQISELHDRSKPQLRAIGKVISQAKLVFMPEYNRTVLYQCWFNLRNRPVVLPNKPYFIPTTSQLNEYRTKYSKELDIFEHYKVILYQGMIAKERDLTNFVKAIKMMGDEYRLVLLGDDWGLVNEYKKIDSHLIHIKFIPAPDYLVFTSMCYMGIVTYDPKMLNTAYCAPNKIYEYSAFGKPMVANNIPGLKILQDKGAAELVDEEDFDSIKKGIELIGENYSIYSSNSTEFYNGTDNVEILRKALSCIEK